MREELLAALELYEGMPLAGRTHWRRRAVPSIEFESEEERAAFLAALDRIDQGLDPEDS